MLYKMAFKYGGNTNGIMMAVSLRIYAFSFIPLWGMMIVMIEKTAMFAKYPDEVEVNQLREMLGGISRKLAIVFWQIIKYEAYESDEPIKPPRFVL